MNETVIGNFLTANPYMTPEGRVLSGADVAEFVELFFGGDA